MLVAWVYVVPPLPGPPRPARSSPTRAATPRLISETVRQWHRLRLRHRPADHHRRRRRCDRTVSMHRRRGSAARVIVFTRNLVPRIADSGSQAPARRRRLPDARAGASATAKVAQGTVTTQRRPRTPPRPCRCTRPSTGRTVVAVVLVISLARGRRQRRGTPCSASCCSPRSWRWASAWSLGYLASYFIARRLKRIERSAEAHRRRRPLGQGARDGRGRDRAAGRHLQRHGRAAAQRLRPGRVRARPRRGAAQRPERGRHRRLRRGHA